MGEPRTAVDWTAVFSRAALTLAGHLSAGRTHLVTQDTVRLGLILSLQSAGVAPSRLALDVSAPGCRGGAADLVVDGIDAAVVDLVYSRDDLGTVRDLSSLGELVHDFLRLAVAATGRRWVVRVLNVKTMDHLRSAAERRGFSIPLVAGETQIIGAQVLDWLPRSARASLAPNAQMRPVSVSCFGTWSIAEDLALHAFEVQIPVKIDGPAPALRIHGRQIPPSTRVAGPSPPGSARAEVVQAMRALAARGMTEVSVTDVMVELQGQGSRFAEPTVSTLLTTHMCADVKGRGIASYDDVDRTPEGRYRLRD